MISTHRVSSLFYSTLFFSAVLTAQHDYGGTPGHAPFPHDHSTNGTGVCWGYAQGRAANICSASDMVPAWQGENDSAWMRMAIPQPWFTAETSDALIRTNAENLIVRFGTQQHVVYLPQAYLTPPAQYSVWHIENAGGSPKETTMYYGNWNGNVCYKLSIPGKGDYYSTGFQVLSLLEVTAQNRFYSGQSSYVDEGSITVAGQEDDSPYTIPLLWTQQFQLTAEDWQESPSGYRQKFIEWKRGGVSLGDELTLTISPDKLSTPWEAVFKQMSQQTFVPNGGGAILVDDTVRYGSYSRYAKVAPGMAESVTAQSVDQIDQQSRLHYVFLHWTANGDTVLTPTLTYTAGAPVTWTATSVPKPMAPANRTATGDVDEYPLLSWDAHPSSNVTKFEVWRRIKDKVSGNGPQVRIAIVSSSVTSYTDYDVLITAGYDDFIAEYDVRSVYESGSYTSCSDPLYFAMVFGTEPQAKSLAREQKDLSRATPIGFALDVSPNPFNPTTTITYSLPSDQRVRLGVFDALGREVVVLIDQAVSAGTHTVRWEGSGRSSGTFYVRMTAGSFSLAKRMILLK